MIARSLWTRRKLVAAAWIVLLVGVSVWGAVEIARKGAAPPSDGAALTVSEGQSIESLARALGGGDVLVDTDNDELPDVVENFAYGSDPKALSTTRNGIPDGWLAGFGFDPTQPGVETLPAAIPPPEFLPDAYDGSWPEQFRWTLLDAYRAGRPDTWNESRDGPWRNGIDPRKWGASDDAIPYSWLAHYGLNLTDGAAAQSGGPAYGLREEYAHNTDPRVLDTDEDGLADDQEVGVYRTDPNRFSTSGAGIPDGWLVRYGLPTDDRTVGTTRLSGSGFTVYDTWSYNKERFGDEALQGRGLDPTKTSTLGSAIPDSWLARHGLDPLDAEAVKQTLQRSSDFKPERALAPTPVGKQDLVDVVLSLLDAYRFAIPEGWDEDDRGPWLGGLDPNRTDQDLDGLPDSFELRGWFANRSLGTGPSSASEWYIARSDPFQNDTDGDGLTDLEEFLGRALRGGRSYAFNPTDPQSVDTAFSGLSDGEKVFAPFAADTSLHKVKGAVLEPWLDPTRSDTAGDYLTDGARVAVFVAAAENASNPYTQRFPGSAHRSTQEWLSRLPGAQGHGLDAAAMAKLLSPSGDLDGDGVPNAADPDADEDGLRNGWETDPTTLQFSDWKSSSPRAPTDAANPDTDGDDLPDQWEIEFGRFGNASWDMDATRFDSDGDGDPDGLENADLDGVGWISYHPGLVRQNVFQFTNFHEFREKTNPRLRDQNQDGVWESWAYFWGKEYPASLIRDDAEDIVGILVPQGSIDTVKTKLANPLQNFTGLSKFGPQGFRYWRFDEPVGSPDFLLVRSRGEGFPDASWRLREISDADGETKKVSLINGTYRHTFAQDQTFRLNPYLLDTDGDLMPDDWESFFGCATTGLDPTAPDAPGDADDDDLANIDEFRFHEVAPYLLNPCLEDTDLGGIEDGTELSILNDPTTPTDDFIEGGGGSDFDGDGVFDADEFLASTSPLLPDTDFDGLLDGPDRVLQDNFATDQPLISAFRRLGIAHRVEPGPGGEFQRYTFLGESNRGAPRSIDSSLPSDAVPDGWQWYYGKPPKDVSSAALVALYKCGRPTWWDERRLGPWWWGTFSGTCNSDMDRDGLDDRNGEDPVPAASRHNRPNQTLGRLPDALDSTLAATDLVKLAQGWGECAGNPGACQATWAGAPAHAPVQLSVDPLADLPVLPNGRVVLSKMEVFDVTGKLRLACGAGSCPGVGNRVIVVRLGDEGPVLGAATTEADGSFRAVSCLCSSRSLQVAPGIVLLSRDGGIVTWNAGAGEIPVGALGGARLVVSAYATTATFWSDPATDATHPQYPPGGAFTLGSSAYKSTGRSNLTLPADLTIKSATQLTLDAPGTVAWDPNARTIDVKATLKDLGGRALSGRAVKVVVRDAAGAVLDEDTRDTDTSGNVIAALQLPASARGDASVTASYTPSQQDAAILSGTQSPAQELVLQGPLELKIAQAQTRLPAGSDAVFEVQALSGGQPAKDVIVRAILAGAAKDNVTGADGIAVLRLSLSKVKPGPATIVFRAQPTTSYVAAETTFDVEVVAQTRLSMVAPANASIGRSVAVRGSILLTDGSPIADAEMDVLLGKVKLGVARSGTDGLFQGTYLLGKEIPTGQGDLAVTYGGSSQYEAANATKPIRLAIATLMDLEGAIGAPGETVRLSGRLSDFFDRPLVGETVQVTLGNETKETLTRAEGAFWVEYGLPATASPGPIETRVAYGGSRNGTYQASADASSVLVHQASTLSILSPSQLRRGNNSLVGTLRDQTGVGIRDADISLEIDGRPAGRVKTDGQGRFTAPVVIDSTRPNGRIAFRLAYDGDAAHGPATLNHTLPLRLPVRLALFSPPDAGRGSTLSVRATGHDDQGRLLPGISLDVQFLDRTQSHLVGTDPFQALVLPVPADADVGEATLRVSFAGNETLEPASVERDLLVVDGVHLDIAKSPSEVDVGAPFEVQIRLTDTNGDPLTGRKIGLRLDGQQVSVVSETNETGYATAVLTATSAGALRAFAFFPGDETHASTLADVEVASQEPVTPVEGDGRLILATVVALIVAAGLVAYLLWIRSRRRALSAVRDILLEAERRIAAGTPWAASVKIAYLRLSTYVSTFGFRERRHESPRDFARALRRRIPVPKEALVGLITLFERASYAPVDVGLDESRQARDALRQISASVEEILSGSRPTPSVEAA